VKFSNFWAEILSQNNALKWGLLSVSIVCVVLATCLISIAAKEPLIIERSCFDKALAISPAKQTDEEVERFVREALPRRFDTQVLDSQVFLSADEYATRLKEVDEFSKKGMSQRILVNSIKVAENSVAVNADRILSVGSIRSALPFPLILKIKATDRSNSNPYGLILSDTSIASSEGQKR
jgi:hypothetical protein